jgi:hypothetical protein
MPLNWRLRISLNHRNADDFSAFLDLLPPVYPQASLPRLAPLAKLALGSNGPVMQ